MKSGIAFAVLGALLWGCSSDDGPARGNATGGGPSSGGASSTGGAANGGNPQASGGASTSGGAPNSGGSTSTGGAPPAANGKVVTTKAGKVQGFVSGNTQEFLGIPYAEPPVGELRFAPPKPAVPWTDVRPATALGAMCPQTSGPSGPFIANPPPQSEDCLSLNVYAPKGALDAKAPVIVFIHPGSAGMGGQYDGASLSEAGGAVVVTVNFRLGALGYLVNQGLDAALGVPSGNMGLRDQQLALGWVQDNIAAFGGDPANVTVLGSGCLHLFAAGSRNLAKRFVTESVSCLSNPVQPLRRASVAWISDKLVTKLCPGAADPVTCLRGLSTEALVTFKNTDNTDPGPDPFGSGFYPQMDGSVLQDYPKNLLQKGDFNHGELLLGANRYEARVTRLDPETTKQLKDSKLAFGFYAIFTYVTQWPGIQSLYQPATDADSVDSFERVSTDTWFRCPIRAMARAAAAKGSPTYLYSFEHGPAVTGLELDYIFGAPNESTWLHAPPMDVAAPVPLTPSLVTAVQSYVTRFAKTGNPTPSGSELSPWPAYDAATDKHLVLDADITVGTAFSQKECDAWDAANATAEN